MKTSLVHTCLDTSKIDPFNGTFFKRWQERVYYAIDVVNLMNILIDSKPKSDSEDLSNWENGNKKVRHAILSTITNEFFDVYCQYKGAKEIWDALTRAGKEPSYSGSARKKLCSGSARELNEPSLSLNLGLINFELEPEPSRAWTLKNDYRGY